MTADELAGAEDALVQFVQRTSFREEYDCLSSGETPKKSSRPSPLTPQLKDGSLLVGGRLQDSELPEGKKHQQILP